ncbi:MAG: hypothetical protein RLZZ373_2643 [Pseudomonadota bacterium]|jgi:hypothetical protein
MLTADGKQDIPWTIVDLVVSAIFLAVIAWVSITWGTP